MSTYTTNYNLEKPDSTDDFKDFRSNYNSNMDIIDANLGGGGGGSSVSWSQLQVTGDKIATITVSGIPQDVFAPNSQTFTMAVSRANINSGESYSTIFGKIKKWFNDLKTVAFSGSYNDLSDKPTIPTVNDGTLTIQQNGTTVGTFTANQSGNTTVNLSGGGGSAHTIVNESGTSLADEPNLQFTDGLKATDDSVNSKTVVGVNTTFTEAVTRTNIASGDTFATILGKIKKFFTDLKTVAFTGAYSDLSGTENVAVKNANNRFSQSQIIDAKNGTVSTDGYSYISVGNGTPSGTSGNSFGIVEIYGKGSKYVDLKASNVTANRNIELPDKNGTVALTSDIPDISTKVSKSGDTMTGNLAIDKAGEAYVKSRNTNTSCDIYLDSDTDGKHGLWSNGYWNGSSFVSEGKWILSRDTDGKARVPDVLPLWGGTLQSSTDTPLYIKSNNNNGAYIGYQGTNGTIFGYIGVRSDKNPYIYTDNNYLILTSKCTYHDYKTSSGNKTYNITMSGDGMMYVVCKELNGSERVSIISKAYLINLETYGSGFTISNTVTGGKIETSLSNVYVDIMSTVPITVTTS